MIEAFRSWIYGQVVAWVAQARGFRLDVVGLDVEAEAGRVIDRLDDDGQSGQRLLQPGELGLFRYRAGGGAEGGGASDSGVSISRS